MHIFLKRNSHYKINLNQCINLEMDLRYITNDDLGCITINILEYLMYHKILKNLYNFLLNQNLQI